MLFTWSSFLRIMFATLGVSSSIRGTLAFSRNPIIPSLGGRRIHKQGTVSPLHSTSEAQVNLEREDIPLYRSEGLFAVNKPLEWTSQDMVSYIRGILERDARNRGAKPARAGRRKGKNKKSLKVGHGGTLDPLASGVLVIGVGKGTKELQSYLSGSKTYFAQGEFGFETTTLDMDPAGNVTKKAPFDHVTIDAIEAALPSFTGEIMQVPPIFSALKKGGKKLYEEARKGKTAEDLEIEARPVRVYRLDLVDPDEAKLPRFDIEMECGGGTFVRCLIRDIARQLDTVATTTVLQRTQQGPFMLADTLEKDDLTPDNIYAAIDKVNEKRAQDEIAK